MSTDALLKRHVSVLLTSVGNEAIHGFVDDLRRRAPAWTLIGTDMRSLAAGLYRCDHCYTVPATREAGYLAALKRLIARHSVDLIVPLSTRDQDFFAAESVRGILAPVPIMVSEVGAVARANYKVNLFEHMAEVLPAVLPDYAVVHHPDEAWAALEVLVQEHGAALLKVDGATGGRGMVCVGEVGAEHAVPFEFTPLEYARADRIIAANLRAGRWPRLAVAYLPGAEYSVDVLCGRGAVEASVVRERFASTGGLALEAVTVCAPDVDDAARSVARAIGLDYVNNIQFRRDGLGVPRLMEINPRIPGTIGLTVEAGLNLPLAAMCQALGQRLSLPEPELGVRVMRYYGCVFTRRPTTSA